MIGSIVCHGREGAGGARTVADGCGNVLAMLYGMRAMSLVAHSHCNRSKISASREAGHQAAAPEGGREKRRDRRDFWLCVYISGSMQAIG